MRIGIDATALPPQPVGAGNYIIQLIRALAELDTGHEFIIFAHQHGRELIGQPARQGFRWVVLPDKSPAQRLLWEQVAFPRLVGKAKMDLLHSLHYTRPLALPCSSVVTFHDMTFFLYPHLHTRAKRLFFPQAIRLSARKADALIAVSESTRRDAIRLLGISAQKIFTVPLGVTPDFRPVGDPVLLDEVRRRYNLPNKFILYVGIVEPRKNLPMLIQSYGALGEANKSYPLVIVGRLGWRYEEVLRQVESLELKEKVQFTGYIPVQDLPIVYNLASVFVYPSIYEGFGLPPLEAMACGTPVITTAVSSMPEHVGEAGILIPPQDGQALSRAMLALLDDQALQDQLSDKGIQQAARFTWKITAQETLKVYQHVLGRL